MELERYVTSFDGTRLYTRAGGRQKDHQGWPLVLCDGLGCAGFIWRYLIPAFVETHRIVHFHYRGHGLSDPPTDPNALDIPTFRDDLQAVMDAHGLDRAVLIGHSMGVQVALDTALAHPERVAGLVAICGSYGHPLDAIHGDDRWASIFPPVRDAFLLFPQAGQVFWRRLLSSPWLRRFAMRFEVNGRLLRSSDFAPYFEHLASMDVRVFMRLLERIRLHTVEDRLSEIEVPTLIVAGEKDTLTPVWLSHRMHMLMPHAELLVMPGGTHVAPLEIPELVHLRLRQFLREGMPPKKRGGSRKTTARSAPGTRRSRRSSVGGD